MAGGYPISGIITSNEIAQSKPWANPSGSSSSYGGNPLAAAAALSVLRIILSENLVEHSKRVGRFLLQKLLPLQDKYPFLGCVQGQGLLIGLELVKNRETREPLPKEICVEIFKDCLRSGLLAMIYTTPVRINPPLVISQEQAEEGFQILDQVLERIGEKFNLL